MSTSVQRCKLFNGKKDGDKNNNNVNAISGRGETGEFIASNENVVEKCVYISRIPHIRQKYSFDCGVTCLRMVAGYCVNDENITTESIESIIEKNDRKQGLWSIELAFILNELGVRASFYTKMLGADENYANTTYYGGSFSNDENRVNEMFRLAEHKGMTVFRKRVTLEYITKHLNLRLPVIALVNANKLRCTHCDTCFSLAIKQLLNQLYQGHYIVLVGYDSLSECILYRDPGSRDTLCSTSVHQFEIARKSLGTDEDILFLYSNKNCLRF